MTRQRFNILLVLVIAGLLALVIFEPGKEKPAVPAKLTTLQPQEIEHVLIQPVPPGQELEMEKRDGHWYLLRPRQVRVRDEQVASLLKLAAATSYREIAASSGNAAEYGFDRAHNRVRLGDIWIEFGTTHPIEQKRYVRVGPSIGQEAQQHIHLLDDYYYHLTGMGWAEWVEKRLLPEHAKLLSVRFFDHTLSRQDQSWQLQPGAWSAAEAGQLADSWSVASALSVEEATAEASVPPQVEVRYELAGETLSRAFSARQNQAKDQWLLQSQDPPLIYHFTVEQANHLFRPPARRTEDKVGPDTQAEPPATGKDAGTAGG